MTTIVAWIVIWLVWSFVCAMVGLFVCDAPPDFAEQGAAIGLLIGGVIVPAAILTLWALAWAIATVVR